MDKSVIDFYEQGSDKLLLAVRGLTDEDLRWVPPTDAGIGLWSIHQLVIHLQDAETAFFDRGRRILAEDSPTLLEWSEDLFAARLHYADQSAEDAMTLIQLMRRQLSRILRKGAAADLDRAGMHSRAGRQTLNDVLAKANWHLDHHIKFIHQKRAKMGKEMW